MYLLQSFLATLAYKTCYLMGFENPQVVIHAFAALLQTCLLLAACAGFGYGVWVLAKHYQTHWASSPRTVRPVRGNASASVAKSAVRQPTQSPANIPKPNRAPTSAAQQQQQQQKPQNTVNTESHTQQILALMQKQMRALEAKLEQSTQQPVPAMPVPQPPSAQAAMDLPYQNAIQMIKTGSPIQEVVAACELTWGEAELLAALHR